jgi:hypothetical protein
VGLLNSIKQAYFGIGIHTAPPGTLLYRVHQMVKAGTGLGQSGRRTHPVAEHALYDQDGLRSIHNHDFMSDPAFVRAYQRGVQAASDLHWHWRAHVGLWAARLAARLPGDFVECGTNRGFLSSAIMTDLDWNKTGRRFYLLDTFSGLAERYVSVEEKKNGVLERNRRELDSGSYTKNAGGACQFRRMEKRLHHCRRGSRNSGPNRHPGRRLSTYRHELLAPRSRGDTPPLGSANARGACAAR